MDRLETVKEIIQLQDKWHHECEQAMSTGCWSIHHLGDGEQIEFFTVVPTYEENLTARYSRSRGPSKEYSHGFNDGFECGYENALDMIFELFAMSDEELEEELKMSQESIKE